MTRTRFSAAAILLTTALLPLLSVCKKLPVGHPPAIPSEPIGISNGGYNSPYEFAATAADPDTDSVAIHFSWGDGASSEWSAWVASGETVAMSHSWASPGSYQVKAQAKDKPGLTSDWSAPHQVVVVSTRAPNAPGTPNGPSEGRRDTLYTFTTITTDPDGDGVCYRFAWGDRDTSGWSDWVPSGSAMALSHAYSRSGTFGVRAQAKDANEVTSAWSNPHQVAIPNPSTPNAPSTPSGPRCAHTGQTCSYSTRAGEPDGDSIAIRFDWGDSDTSVWSSFVRPDSPVTTTHSWRDTGSFHVRAQARDEYGATSSWSSDLGVVIGNTAPVAETPWGLWEGTWGVPYSVHAAATDPEGDSVAIRFEWGDGDTSAWSQIVASDSQVTMAHSWQDTGTFYVSAQARDVAGAASYWTYGCPIMITRLKWRYGTGDWVSSPAVGSDGTVFVGSWDTYVYAITPEGDLKWRHQTGVVESRPAVGPDGAVYVGSHDHYLYALNPDGTLRWRYQTGGWVWSSPAIGTDGVVYVGSRDSCLYVVEPSGALRWRYRTGGSVNSSPAVGPDGTVYFGSDDEFVYALNPDSSLRWRYRTSDSVSSSPAVGADGTVYVGSDDGYLYALNPNGTRKWRYETGGPVHSSPTIASDGTVYAGSNDGYLYAIDPAGTLKWRYQTGSWVRCSAAIGPDATVYFGSKDYYFYAVNPDGSLSWRYKTVATLTSSPVTTSNGMVYVGVGSALYAFRGLGPPAIGRLPKVHHDNRNTGRVGGGRRQ